jgi:hypothetical protein
MKPNCLSSEVKDEKPEWKKNSIYQGKKKDQMREIASSLSNNRNKKK